MLFVEHGKVCCTLRVAKKQQQKKAPGAAAGPMVGKKRPAAQADQDERDGPLDDAADDPPDGAPALRGCPLAPFYSQASALPPASSSKPAG